MSKEPNDYDQEQWEDMYRSDYHERDCMQAYKDKTESYMDKTDPLAGLNETDLEQLRYIVEKCAQECSAGAAVYEGMGFDKQAQALRSTSSLIRAKLEK